MRSVAALVLAVLAWLASYASGLWPWLGGSWWTRRSTSAGAITIAGEERAGYDLGLTEFVFVAGQRVVVEYDVEVRAGSLWIYVFRPLDSNLGDGWTHHVTRSGAGSWGVTIPETGFYHITVEPSVTQGPGRGWDLTYSARWGARFGGG